MKKHIVSFLAAFVFVTVMPVCVCTAFAKQPVQLEIAADVTTKKVKTNRKAKVSTKDGEYEITYRSIYSARYRCKVLKGIYEKVQEVKTAACCGMLPQDCNHIF